MRMADTPPSYISPNTIGSSKVDGGGSSAKATTCSCTKVSNMQLFHEMKQEFATVPDHIVWQYVTNNCHNRPECVMGLKKEAESHPGSVQAYPQALRNNNKKPQRSVGTGSLVQTNNLSSSNESIEKPKSEVSLLSDSSSDIQAQANDNNNLPKVPERPNTLNISKINDSYQHLRPKRSAPPPPPPPITSNHFFQQTSNHSTSESGESLNVSLNVTVSPVSSNRPPVRPPRHTTALSVQPESPFTQNTQQCPRSYTSVNFTLRQPSNTPQSPIDISAGPSPSLTYSSSSYDARKGFQSRLEITVGSTGSSISASRTRHGSYNSLADNTESSYNPITSLNSVEQDELLHRQLLSKERLSIELENDKKRLQSIQREVKVLQAHLPPGSSQLLSEEIERLRRTCNQMAQEVEEAGPAYALGETNEAFYQNIYTGQRLIRPPRPQRPPPPPSLLNNNQINDDDQMANQDGQSWTCNMCTFQNHPLLNKCEQCEMPLLTTTSSGNVQANNRLDVIPRFQNISYQQQSAPAVLHNPFQYNQAIGFNDMHSNRLTQTQQN